MEIDSTSKQLNEHIAAAFGKKPINWFKPHTGLSKAQRYVVQFDDGSKVFVKAAVDEDTESWLCTEYEVLRRIDDSFVPKPLAWLENSEHPILIIEDLSKAHWPADHNPVVWKPGQFDLLFKTLQHLGTVPAPESLPDAQNDFNPQWQLIADEAEDFLSMGLCSESWFRESIDILIESEKAVNLSGECLVHNDIRSDNLCFIEERMVLVDWSHARRGHPEQDLAGVLSTLPLEGGPDPYEVLPNGGNWAAYGAATNARRAYLDKQAPEWLRRVLQRIAIVCLMWATKSLDLHPWDGVNWKQI